MEHNNYNIFLEELLNSSYDTFPTKSEQEAYALSILRDNLEKRDSKLTELLEKYINECTKRIGTNNFFKKFIFWFFIGLLFLLTIAVFMVFLKVNVNDTTITSLIALVSVSGTYLASLISIFRIMSKYLFPIDEFKDTIQMIKVLTEKDDKLQEIFFERTNKDHD